MAGSPRASTPPISKTPRRCSRSYGLRDMQCSSCKTDNPPDAAFCEQCGSKLEVVCPVCKTAISPGARFCKKCGAAIVASAPASVKKSFDGPVRIGDVTAHETMEGERKTATMLFADIKGSMELIEHLDPEEARAIVDPAFKLMMDAAQRYGGHVAQSTGDGIFALFGAPVAYANTSGKGAFRCAQGGESFTAKEIRDLFVSAGEPVPKNLTRDIKATVQARWITPYPDQQDRYYVTSSGEAAAASGFTERSIVRRGVRSRATNGSTPELAFTRRTSRNGGARSVLDELLTEDYFAEPRTYHDIIQSASERGHRLQRTDLTQPLLDLVQSRPPKLKRHKVTKAGVQRPVWAYRNSRP